MPERNRKSESSSKHMFWWQSFRVRVKMNSRNIDSIKWFTCRSEKVLPLCLWRMERAQGTRQCVSVNCNVVCVTSNSNFSGSSRKLGLFDCCSISRLIESKLFTLYFIAKHRVLPCLGRLYGYTVCGRTPFYIWIENHYEYANGNTGWDITCSNL